jgi:hypothetical protein
MNAETIDRLRYKTVKFLTENPGITGAPPPLTNGHHPEELRRVRVKHDMLLGN